MSALEADAVKDLVVGCEPNVSVVLSKNLNAVEIGADWMLAYGDGNSEPQSLEEELKRLQALRSYLILDTAREFPFERLTALASRVLETPIALVSLVDVGRQWFMSNRGLGDVRETPRKHAFCAHAIASKDQFLIVNDAAVDPRFANNPLVTGPPHIRFYAGSPLQSPEGYKLGTFCVIDTKPRPNGLDLDEKQNLQEFSALAVQVLVSRRRKRERECEKNSQLIACTAHDLLTPLSGIELSLALLKDDAEFQNRLTKEQREGIRHATDCSSMLQEICRNVRSAFGETKSAFELSYIRSKLNTFRLDELVQRLYLVMDAVEKKVPIKITIDKDVPFELVTDDAKIFRCAMNFLVVACARTHTGIITLRFTTRQEESNENPLVYVQCDDTAPAIDLDSYEHLFKPVTKNLHLNPSASTNGTTKSGSCNLELALFSVACEMNIIGGEYGFRPYSAPDGGTEVIGTSNASVGSTFWFCLPYTKSIRKNSSSKCKSEVEVVEAKRMITRAIAEQFNAEVVDATVPLTVSTTPEASTNDAREIDTTPPTPGRKKKALIIEDSVVVLKMLSKSLTKLGFEVTHAENGMEGLEELKGCLFDLTLCDFLMPIMDGLDCVHQYRDWEKAHRPCISQRIIGISAHASTPDVEKGLKLGMNDYKDKPVTFKQLKEMVSTGEQKQMSKRLDFVDDGDAGTSNDKHIAQRPLELEGRVNKRCKGSNSIEFRGKTERTFTCLILTPTSAAAHVQRVHETIRQAGWQSTSAQNDTEAWSFLKMRLWDVVLVDQTFATLITAFREWESKRRTHRQVNIIAVSEKITPASSDSNSMETPAGFDEVISKPMGLTALRRLLFVKGDALSLNTSNGKTTPKHFDEA